MLFSRCIVLVDANWIVVISCFSVFVLLLFYFRFLKTKFLIQWGLEYLTLEYVQRTWRKMNRTSSAPKSVLRYVLDKGQYFNLETSFTQSCSPNIKTDGQWRVKQVIFFWWQRSSEMICFIFTFNSSYFKPMVINKMAAILFQLPLVLDVADICVQNRMPLENQTEGYHLNTEHIRYSSPNCNA